MFDRDKSGEITFDEFGSLYRYIVDWQNCFKTFDRWLFWRFLFNMHSNILQIFDRDQSGSINHKELQDALSSFGYNLSSNVYSLLIRKFDRTNKQAVKFDDFIQCCLVLHVSHSVKNENVFILLSLLIRASRTCSELRTLT